VNHEPFYESDPLPAQVAQHRSEIRGRKRVLPVSDGWLVAGNAGEYGGGLWWVSKSGDSVRSILDVPMIGLVRGRANDQNWAFGGSTHGGMGPGYLFRVTREGGTWRAVKSASFDQPVFLTGETDSGMLLVTGNAIYSMDQRGTVSKLHGGKWWGRTPVSISIMEHGVQILIGMDGVVVVLRKAPGAKYDEKWYALPACG
jgi:hypothetical protein